MIGFYFIILTPIFTAKQILYIKPNKVKPKQMGAQSPLQPMEERFMQLGIWVKGIVVIFVVTVTREIEEHKRYLS